MLDAILKTLHVLSVIVWIGGMVFAHFFLRPSLAVLEPPQRLALMAGVLGRFFAAVTWVAPLAWLSGAWIYARAARAVVESGGSFAPPLYWHLMAALGTLMLAVFFFIRAVPFRAMVRARDAGDLPAAAAALARVRSWVALNLGLGTVILLVTLLRWP